MFANVIKKLTQDFSTGLLVWIIFGWILVLLLPLFQIIPNAATSSNHPWKVELFFSIFFVPLLIFAFRKRDYLNSKKEELFNKNLPIFLIPFFIFILWSGFSLFWAKSFQSVSHHTLIWAAYFIFFVACLVVIKVNKSINLLIIPTTFVALVLYFSCIIDFITVTDFSALEGILRIRYAKFAEMIIIVAPIFWALALYSKNFKKSYFYLLAGLGAWITVMFSLSRGAFLAGIGGFVFFFIATLLFSQRNFRRKTLLFAGIWLAFTLFIQITFSIGSSIPSTSDYLANKRNSSEPNKMMRIYTWKVSGQMISDNLLLGVGADNFGLMFNDARSNYALNKPNDEQNQIGEDYVFERSHNELIQIFAELGIIGILIFISFTGCFGYLIVKNFIQNSYRFSPLLLACISGMIAFFTSSMFSSFSFRAIQNGLVFFLVLAVATNELLKIQKKKTVDRKRSRLAVERFYKPALIFSIVIVSLLTFTSFKSGISQYNVYLAETSSDFSEAGQNYRNAIFFEKENASAYFSFGIKQLNKKQPDKAAENLRIAIDKGLGVTSTYSYLATSQVMLNDTKSAEYTMAEAVKIFPRSVFARVRYAALLEQNGKIEDSAKQLELAKIIDKKQAEGWYYFITKGSDETALKAREEKTIPELPELLPLSSMYAILDDENVLNRFPNRLAQKR